MTDSDGSIDGGRPDAATILAAVAIVAGLALAVAGVASVAANWSRIPLRPDAVLAALPLSLRVGVPLAALGVGCGGASGLPSVPLSPTGRQRRVLVAGALVAGSGAVTGAVPVLGGLVRLGLTPDALGALPAVVGWTLIAAGLGGGALPEPVRTRATRLATGAYARVVGATAGPLPPALRRGLLAAGAVVVGLGGVLARPLLAPTGDGLSATPMTIFLGIYLLGLGWALAAVGAVLPGGSRLPAPAAPQRVLVLAGAAVLLLVPPTLPALIPLGSRGGGVFHLGTTLVLAGLCWWVGEAVAARA